MLNFRTSGQFLYFNLTSAISGNAVTGASGAISGIRWVDGGTAKLLSGNIVEDADGMYHANLYDWDTSGNNIGYLFTASGCVPVSYMVVTTNGFSGDLYTGSGINTVVPAATLSGGLFLASGSINSGVLISGVFVTATAAAAASGTTYLASGSIPIASLSGVNAVVPISTLSGVVANSGLFVSVPIASVSGLNAVVPAGTLSGGIYPPSIYNTVVANTVTQKASTSSGNVFLNSGSSVLDNWYVGNLICFWSSGGSGEVRTIVSYQGSGNLAILDQPFFLSGVPLSGMSYVIWTADNEAGTSGQGVIVGTNLDKSGYNLTSGGSFIASGAFANVPPATLSGVVANSGLFVSVPIATISGLTANSGLFVSVPIATLSGVVANSGLNVTVPIASVSGLNAVVPPATLSGLTATANVTLWQGVAPNALISSGRLDAAFNVRTNVARSGTSTTIQLDAGVPTGISGVYDGQTITIVAGTGAGRSRIIQNMGSSGIAFVSPAWDASGVPDTTSVFTITPGAPFFSGVDYPPSGVNVVVPPASVSGVFATVPIASVSGLNAVVPPSTLSGVVVNSGLFVSVPIATLSGVQPVSGATVTVPISSISGVVANSGLFVSVPIASVSGINAVVPIATISGTTVVVPPATLSGLTATANVTLWQGVSPNALISSGRLDAAFNTHTGVARSGTSTTIQLDASVPTGISGVYDGQTITIVAGTGAGRARIIQNMGSSGIAFINPAWDASGVPDTTSVFTITPGAPFFSGVDYPPSGVNAVVPPSTLSGVVANSGLFVNVPIATISGLNAVVPASTLSGGIYLASGSINSGVITSGIFVNATAQVQSGQVYLASGTPLFFSGLYNLASGSVTSGVINSGVFVTATATVQSGQVYLASGTPLFFSGLYNLASGSVTSGVINSGVFVTATASAPASGTTYLASGSIPIASLSGVNAVVPPSTLSGVVANSGLFVTVPIGTISGVQPISGATVTVPVASVSGLNAVVPGSTLSGTIYLASGALSGQPVSLLSGISYLASGNTVLIASGQQVVLASGQQITLASGALSGQFVTLLSGLSFLASGSVSLASGSFFMTTYASGVVGGGSGNIPSAWGGSGATTVGQNLDKSGYTDIPISGQVFIASGTGGTVSIASGSIYLASGIIEHVLQADLSGMQNAAAKNSMIGAALKLTSRFQAKSGTTYMTDGVTIFMTQTPVTDTTMVPIRELGVGH